jgi:hypothetical protein
MIAATISALKLKTAAAFHYLGASVDEKRPSRSCLLSPEAFGRVLRESLRLVLVLAAYAMNL